MSQICARCGTINKDESQFCLYCGGPLPMRPTEPPRPAAPSPPRPTPPTPRPMSVAPPRTTSFVGLFAGAFFLYRYSLRTLSGSLVISLEAAVLAALLFIYIGSGLYWTSARRRALVAAAFRAPRP